MSEHRLFPYFLIVGAGGIWGATFSLALIATADGAHPLSIAAWQVVLTAIFFLIACLGAGVPLFRRAHLRHYVVLALIGITVPNLCYYYGAPHLSAGILSITISTVTMFTYAIMLVLGFESLLWRRLCGILLGMIAILLLVLPDQGLEQGDASWWILLVVVSAFMYAIENVYIGRGIPDEIDIREYLFASNLVAILLLFPLSLAMGVAEPPGWLLSKAGLALGGIALISGFAYLMFFYAIKLSGPVFASQAAYVVTIAGVIWGIIIFSEQHSGWVWSSVVVMMAGLFLVNPDEKETHIVQDDSVSDTSV